MDSAFFRQWNTIYELWKNPLYQNSFYIALGKITDTGFGFLFWTAAARLYSVADVGIATALISSLGIVMAFSRLGFDVAIIRFMPGHDRSAVFSSCLWITAIASLAVSIIYLLTVGFFSPEIAFVRDYALLFIIFSLVNSITLTTGNAFLSFRRADYRFVQNLLLGARIFLLFPLIALGSIGIFSALGIACGIAALFAFILIVRFVSISPYIDRDFAKETFSFSSLNYVASLLQSIPTLILPIIVLNLLGAEDAALYFIAFAVGNLVLIIPDAMTTSFFVEGSHGVKIKKAAVRTLTVTFTILVPAVLFIFFFGYYLLGLFGQNYLAAFDLLKIIALSAFFVSIYNLFIPIQNIRLQVRGILVINLIRFILLLGFSYMFICWCGLVGAGYAWLGTYLILAIGLIGLVIIRGWVKIP